MNCDPFAGFYDDFLTKTGDLTQSVLATSRSWFLFEDAAGDPGKKGAELRNLLPSGQKSESAEMGRKTTKYHSLGLYSEI